MWTTRSLDPALARVGIADAPAANAARSRLGAVARDFGPLAAALALGAGIGAVYRDAAPTARYLFELGVVVGVAAIVSAAILPRAARATSGGPRALSAHLVPALAAQRAFAVLACAAAVAALIVRGFDPALGWIAIVLPLQLALASGLALFAAAVGRTRIGRRMPARLLVPAWVLASPGAWLVSAPTSDSTVGWNPLHHLVAAWRAILVPSIGRNEAVGTAVLQLAPVALLFALLGFAAFAAMDGNEDPVST